MAFGLNNLLDELLAEHVRKHYANLINVAITLLLILLFPDPRLDAIGRPEQHLHELPLRGIAIIGVVLGIPS